MCVMIVRDQAPEWNMPEEETCGEGYEN